MMKKIALGIIFIFVIFILILAGCASEQRLLGYPDKIIIYKNGTKKLIKRSNLEFNKIIDTTSKRFNNKVSIMKINVDDKVVKQRENDVLTMELIYNREQELDIVGESVSELKYTRLLFPLESNDKHSNRTCLYYGDGKKYYNNLLIDLYDPDELINLLNVIE